MASQKVQYLRCAASLSSEKGTGLSLSPGEYAAFLGICDALILNFFLCHPKTDFLRVHQGLTFTLRQSSFSYHIIQKGHKGFSVFASFGRCKGGWQHFRKAAFDSVFNNHERPRGKALAYEQMP